MFKNSVRFGIGIIAMLVSPLVFAGPEERNLENYEACRDYLNLKASSMKPDAVAVYEKAYAEIRTDFDDEAKAKLAKKGSKKSMHLPRIIAGAFEPCKEVTEIVEIGCRTNKDGPGCAELAGYLGEYDALKKYHARIFKRAYEAGQDSCSKRRNRKDTMTGENESVANRSNPTAIIQDIVQGAGGKKGTPGVGQGAGDGG